jgi:phage/plasmid-associated DNA primase
VFEEQTIIGKLLMVDDDFPAGGSLPDGFMKKYSEEKPATANIKWGDAINFRARCLPMLLTNHWPIVHDTTPAFLDRALVIPFTHRIAGSQRNDQQRSAMMLELPGVLNRFVKGLKRLRKRGDWDIPITCNEAAEEWAARANPFLSFIADCLVISNSPNDRLERGSMYESFLDWYGQQSGSKASHNAMHRGLFYERMREKFGKEFKSSGQFYFRGIRITDDAPLRVNELKVVSDGESDDWDDVE